MTGTGREATRFVLVGIAAAGLLFAATYLLLRLGLQPFAAGLMAYIFAFAVAYALHQVWTFAGRASHRHALPRYLSIQAASALFSAGTAQIATSSGLNALPVAAATALVASGASYLLSSRWAFAGASGDRR